MILGLDVFGDVLLFTRVRSRFFLGKKNHGRPMAQSHFKQDIIISEKELYIDIYRCKRCIHKYVTAYI